MTDLEQKEELAEFDESVPLTAEDEEGNVTTVMEATAPDGETLTQLEEALSQLTKGNGSLFFSSTCPFPLFLLPFYPPPHPPSPPSI